MKTDFKVKYFDHTDIFFKESGTKESQMEFKLCIKMHIKQISSISNTD